MERHADDELGLAVTIDVAGGQRPTGLVLGVAVELVAVGAERAECDGGAGGLALDDEIAPEYVLVQIADTATSSLPSPVQSPAATAQPALELPVAPLMRKPPSPRLARSTLPWVAEPNAT